MKRNKILNKKNQQQHKIYKKCIYLESKKKKIKMYEKRTK